MTPDIIDLIALQRAEFAKAGRLRLWMIAAQTLVAVAAVASIFVEAGPSVLLLAVAGILALATWVFCDRRYQASRSASGRARRAALIMGGLGQEVSQTELLSIRETLSVSTAEAARHVDPYYFASKAPAGRRRLGEMLQESAFWTSRLQSESARLMWGAFLATLTITAIAFILVVAFRADELETQVARVIIAILALLLSSDMLGSALGHSEAAVVSERIVTRLSDAEGRGYPETDLLLILSDYNALWEATPIALPRLYELHKPRLEANFRLFQQTRDAQTRASVPDTPPTSTIQSA